jgi:hypothetical protein
LTELLPGLFRSDPVVQESLFGLYVSLPQQVRLRYFSQMAQPIRDYVRMKLTTLDFSKALDWKAKGSVLRNLACT